VLERVLGRSDLAVSVVGLSLAAFPRWRDEELRALVRHALELGITFFDTDDREGDGRGERLLGEALRGERERVTIATKFGYRPLDPLERATTGERERADWSLEWAGQALDQSLRRLGTEPVDLWQLHHPSMAAIESDELFGFLDDQVAKGKIRAYGVALGPGQGYGDEGAAALGERGVAAAQLRWSLFEQDPGRELAPLAAERGASLVARLRLPPAGDPRLAHLDFLTRDRDQSIGQATVKFLLRQPAVASVLPSAERVAQLTELAAAPEGPDLTAEDLDMIAERYEEGFELPSPS
jgi:aryl-alcohol dehydrogenase-like predicted oxidoreductase